MFWGILRLVRLSNSLPASALVLLGAKLAGVSLLDERLWFAVAAMWCITAFGYVSNDLTDQAEDLINKPDRPLPAGVVTHYQATRLAIGLGGVALLLSARLGWFPLFIAGVVLALLMLYNWRLKGTWGLGNLVIAGLAASALLPGTVAVNGWQSAPLLKLLPAAVALALFILAREVLKTLEDVVGDQVAGKQTAALGFGVRGTLHIIASIAILCFITVILFFGSREYSLLSIVVMVLGVNLPLGWTVYYLMPKAPLPRVRTCLALLKGCYFVGMVALWMA